MSSVVAYFVNLSKTAENDAAMRTSGGGTTLERQESSEADADTDSMADLQVLCSKSTVCLLKDKIVDVYKQ